MLRLPRKSTARTENIPFDHAFMISLALHHPVLIGEEKTQHDCLASILNNVLAFLQAREKERGKERKKERKKERQREREREREREKERKKERLRTGLLA